MAEVNYNLASINKNRPSAMDFASDIPDSFEFHGLNFCIEF